MNVEILLVSCCLEETRSIVLEHVVNNIVSVFPEELKNKITVFDNASTQKDSISLLKKNFRSVYQSDKNVGYWTAIDWWLNKQRDELPKYTYIIESDMIHYNVFKFKKCIEFLDNNDDVGSVRLHEYSIQNKHFYNKDKPSKNSKMSCWQSHTNKTTGQHVIFSQIDEDIWTTTFLTQLPALNRYAAMIESFSKLRSMSHFSEITFQQFYWDLFKRTAILDGGMFNCDLVPYNTKQITGSWSSPEKLAQIGYQQTRQSKILNVKEYNVTLI